MGLIYKVTNKVNKKIYIGQTVSTLTRRKSDHIRRAFSDKCDNTYFYKAILKYGVDMFEWEVLCECMDDDLNSLERYYIEVFNSTDPTLGYNTLPGGNAYDNYCARKRKSMSQKIRFKSIEERKKVGNGKPIIQYDVFGEIVKIWNSQQEAASVLGISACNISGCCNGLYKTSGGFLWRFIYDPLTKDNVYKMDKFLERKKIDRDIIRKKSEKLHKEIKQYTIDGSYLRTWKSIKAASIELNISSSNISSCCKSKSLSAGGFIWRYATDDLSVEFNKHDYFKRNRLSDPDRLKISEANDKPVLQYDRYGNVTRWISVSYVCEKFDYFCESVVKTCKGKFKTAYGFVWRYEDDPLCDDDVKNIDQFFKRNFSNIDLLRVKRLKSKSVRQYSLDDKLIKEWDSLLQATTSLHLSYKYLNRLLNSDGVCTYKGFIWRYREDL